MTSRSRLPAARNAPTFANPSRSCNFCGTTQTQGENQSQQELTFHGSSFNYVDAKCQRATERGYGAIWMHGMDHKFACFAWFSVDCLFASRFDLSALDNEPDEQPQADQLQE